MLLLKILPLAYIAIAIPTQLFEDSSVTDLDLLNRDDGLEVVEITGDELSYELERWGYGSAVLQQGNQGFKYRFGGIATLGYTANYALPSVKQVGNSCHNVQGAKSAFDCTVDVMTAAAHAGVVAVLGYTTYQLRYVGLAEGVQQISNLVAAAGGAESKPADISHNITNVDIYDSQPCANNNKYAKNWGGLHTHFGANKGFKFSCKRSCGKLVNSQEQQNTASAIHAAVGAMYNRGDLNMEFTVLLENYGSEAVARCHMQFETVASNTCPLTIPGNECHVD